MRYLHTYSVQAFRFDGSETVAREITDALISCQYAKGALHIRDHNNWVYVPVGHYVVKGEDGVFVVAPDDFKKRFVPAVGHLLCARVPDGTSPRSVLVDLPGQEEAHIDAEVIPFENLPEYFNA